MKDLSRRRRRRRRERGAANHATSRVNYGAITRKMIAPALPPVSGGIIKRNLLRRRSVYAPDAKSIARKFASERPLVNPNMKTQALYACREVFTDGESRLNSPQFKRINFYARCMSRKFYSGKFETHFCFLPPVISRELLSIKTNITSHFLSLLS